MIQETVIGAIFVAGALALRWAARRFEARQRRRGRWDERGPLYPTEGPPGAGAKSFAERLEVTGQWIPRPVERDPPPPPPRARRRKRRPKAG